MSDATTEPKADLFGWVCGLFGSSSGSVDTDMFTMSKAMTNSVAPVKRKEKTVLVVDDDPLFVKVTCARLYAEGYDVAKASDGSEAIEAVRNKRPNVIVLDVNLPLDVNGMHFDGLRLMSWLKRLDDFKSIPVIMVSTGEPSNYTRLSLGAGATAFFHKRMNPQRLLVMVDHALARKGSAPANDSDTNYQI